MSQRGRVMGLDVGDVRVGVALSDPGCIIAQAWSTVARARDGADLDAIAALAEAEEVVRSGVGWPVTLAGVVGFQAKKVEAFARRVTERTGLPIERWDERLTSVAANRALGAGGRDGRRRRQVVDKVAAALILQGWLDARRSGGPPRAP